MNGSNTILLGRVTKTHGISGELTVRLAFEGMPFDEQPETIFILIDGIQVPFFIESFRQKDASFLILKMEGIDDKTMAAQYTGKKIFVEGPPANGKKRRDGDRLEGFKVIDPGLGKLGTVTDTIPFRENPLLLVSDTDREFYLPVNGDLIRSIDKDNKAITVNLPDGFLESQQ